MYTEKLKDSSFPKSYYLYVMLLVCLTAFIFIGDKAHAAPAAPIKSAYAQPTGTVFYAEQHGDEIFNWTAAVDGAVIAQRIDGYWTYAVIQGNQLIAGPVQYAIQSPPSAFLTSKDVLPLYQQHFQLKNAAAATEMQAPKASRSPAYSDVKGEVRTDMDLTSPHPLLVLLVEFDNVNQTTFESDWQDRIFGTSGKTVNSYYKEASNNKFYFTPANESGGTVNDGVVKVKLNRNHPNTAGDDDLSHLNRQLAADALIAANSQIDFASYDTNGDSYISRDELHIMTIIAGQEAAYADPGSIPSVWGHYSPLYDSESPTLDGKKLLSIDGNGAYTQFGEMQGDHQATIGIIAHELGHDLDLPDLYDVNPSNGETDGVGGFSVMGEGSWGFLQVEELGETPVHFDAWSKVFLGFETPLEIPYDGTDSSTLNLNAIDSTNLGQYNIYKVHTQNPNEYFLLENRQQGVNSGFDQGLAAYSSSSGIAIWHIDSGIIWPYYGSVNDLFPKGIDLESYDDSPADPFYKDGDRFDVLSTPNSSHNDFYFDDDLYSDIPSGVSMFTNSPSASTMTVSVGMSPDLAEMPIALTTGTSFAYTTQWDEAVEVYYVALLREAAEPDFDDIIQGKDSLGDSAAFSGNLSFEDDIPGTFTIDGLANSTDYTLYYTSTDTAGHRGLVYFNDFTTKPTLTVGNMIIQEAAANNGSINATQTVTVTNATYGGFDPGITDLDVMVTNLPEGLDYTVTRTSDTVLTLTFSGQAMNHANANDISDVSVTVASGKIAGAIEAVTSNAFAIDFNDPVILAIGSAAINEASLNDGSITGTQTVTVTNATYGFDPSIATSDVTINNLPTGLGYTVTRTSETVLAITFTGAATNHANANDVSNVSITVAQNKIVGAAGNLTSNVFTINFNDPTPVSDGGGGGGGGGAGGGGGGGFSVPIPAAPEVTNSGDKGVTLGQLKSEVGKDADGNTIETWKIDSDLLSKAIDSLGDKQGAAKRVVIPVTLTADTATTVELPANVLFDASAGSPDTIISITSDGAAYNLPVSVIDLKAIALSLGADLKDMKVNVTMKQVTGQLAEDIAQSAKAAGLNVVGTAIEFSVTVTGNGKSHDVTDFGQTYVSRTIVLNQSVTGLTESVVVYDPATGKMSFVPATFSVVDGKTFVTIQRNGNSIYTVVESNKTFADIQKHWARADIELLASKALIKGINESTFAPDQFITRAQFATMLAQALGLSEDHAAAKFSDVKGTDWHAGYVGAAAKASLVSGFSDGSFRPNDQITREQMAVMVTNAVRFVGKGFGDKADPEQLLAKFKDQAEISQWAQQSVYQVIEAGIMSGVKSDQFSPSDFASRAQAASIMKRLLVHLRFID